MAMRGAFSQLWWLVHRDLAREVRHPQAWARMLLLGCMLILLLTTQVDLPVEQRLDAVAGLLWMAVAFAGTVAVESSMACEVDGGWHAMLASFPISPHTMFFAKFAVNFLTMLLLDAALVPLFVLLTDLPNLDAPWPLVLIILLGSAGFAALGTILGALTAGLPSRSGLLAILLLPLLTPLLFASAEATKIVVAGAHDPLLWLWIQLLGGFAVVFTAMGALLFGLVVRSGL
jgi:heme exporter protein B